jgi:leader peptidase (prepilin peptidase)/N-methyltransferase
MPSLLLLFFSVLAGAAAGYLSNLAADELPRRTQSVPGGDAQADEPRRLHVWRSRGVILLLMVLFPLLAWQLGAAPAPLFVSWCYAWFLVTVLVIDLETRRVLNVMLGPAALFAVLAGLWLGTPSLQSTLAGGLFGLLLFWGLYLLGRMMFGRGALGFGDVKLAGVIGLMTGYPGVLQALLFGVLLGAVGALILLMTRRAGWKSTCAYAPYLAIGAMLSLWAGIGGF